MPLVANITSIFSGLDLMFFVFAALGGILFFVRLVLITFGVGHHDVTTDVHIDDGSIADSDASFKMVNLQGLTIFFLMFGLVGLGMHRGGGFGGALSILAAASAGLAMMAILGKIIQYMWTFQSSGNVEMAHAVGASGTVYLSIPAGGGSGQVQLAFDGQLRIIDAITADKTAVKTGERVEVSDVIDSRILVVRKV